MVGTKVVFCPNSADHVGVLETSDGQGLLHSFTFQLNLSRV